MNTINYKNDKHMMKWMYLLLLTGLMACGKPGNNKERVDAIKKEIASLTEELDSLNAILAKDSGKVELRSSLVKIEGLKLDTFRSYIDVQGRVDAEENVAVTAEIPGTVTRILVQAGDEVEKGQVLAETDARVIQQSIADLEVNYDLAKQVFDKQRNLWEQKIGTEIQFMQAKTTKESLERKMATLQEQLRMTKIVSPITGTVDAVDIKLGQAVAPGIPAIRVLNLHKLKVKADLAETYAGRVRKGAAVRIVFPDKNDTIIRPVSYAARAISAMNRTFGVEVILDDEKEYYPNMVAKLNINDYVSAKAVIAVSARIIQKDLDGDLYVYVAENSVAKKRKVRIGHVYNGLAEIQEGLKEGDKLITAGFELVNEGDAVKEAPGETDK